MGAPPLNRPVNDAAAEAWLAELDARNLDNVARTGSYLTLYAHTRERGAELPWLFMAHLVSRNAGYLMTDLARTLARPAHEPALTAAIENLMALLERANFLIFHDAWFHVLHHVLGRSAALPAGRTPAFVRAAWPRYETAAAAGVTPALERALVMDLVHNEQHFIERRVVHDPRFAPGLRAIEMIEQLGREQPMHFPDVPGAAPSDIRVGRFADLERRIATGARIFDEVLADRGRRDALFAWALAHPHTGSRVVHGGKPGPTLREAWPVARVLALLPGLHAPPEPDPTYP